MTGKPQSRFTGAEDGSFGVDIEQLSARLRFNPAEAQIWLAGERMLLLHQAAFAGIRKELIDTLGMDAARGVFNRMGHVSGVTDSNLAHQAKPHADLLEAFMAGPQLHAIEGVVRVNQVRVDADPTGGLLFGEWIWRNSVEADAHLDACGVASEPVCWTLTGYASGFTSALMGRPILYREIECRGMGSSQCRVVGKPAEAWDDDGQNYLHHSIDLEDIETASAWTSLLNGDAFVKKSEGDRLIGASPNFISMMHKIEKIAPTSVSVLLIGEAGVGKRSAARALHHYGKRSGKPFVTFDCSALSGDQLDAELFGFEKSAIGTARPGRVERANGGTLFLQDIDQLALSAQAKLVQILRDREVERVGASHPRSIDVRLIASSRAPLEEAARMGAFREDLYYRIATIPIVVPPLRERRGDLPLLISHFGEIFAQRHDKQVAGLTTAALSYLNTYDFPGNITELESMIERAVVTTPAGYPIEVSHLPSPTGDRAHHVYALSKRGMLIPAGDLGSAPANGPAITQLLSGPFDLEHLENALIVGAVDQAGGNLTKAAKMLGLTRPQLAYRYQKTGRNL